MHTKAAKMDSNWCVSPVLHGLEGSLQIKGQVSGPGKREKGKREKGKKGKREKGKKGKREKGRMVRLILTVKGFYSGFSCILKFYASDTSINQAISFCILSPESRFASDDSKFAYSGKP